jgi:hypothetical protein
MKIQDKNHRGGGKIMKKCINVKIDREDIDGLSKERVTDILTVAGTIATVFDILEDRALISVLPENEYLELFKELLVEAWKNRCAFDVYDVKTGEKIEDNFSGKKEN